MNLYSVYDEVAQTFNAPFPEANHNSAMRSFGLACSDPQTILAKHPSFELYGTRAAYPRLGFSGKSMLAAMALPINIEFTFAFWRRLLFDTTDMMLVKN